MRLDVMPIASEVLGFSNAWYPLAIETAAEHRLARDLTIRIATACQPARTPDRIR